MAMVERAMPLGGNGGLNFKVVGGTTQPTNPSENTIWVNTDVAIGEWQMVYNEPTTRGSGSDLVAGDIWITNDNFGDISFNPLRKNNIDASIHTIKQWNGASWEGKEAYIFQSSEWTLIPSILRVFPSELACNDENWIKGSKAGTFAMCSTSIYLYGHSDGSYRRLKTLPITPGKYKYACFYIDKMTSTGDFIFRLRNMSGNGELVKYKIDDLDQSLWVGVHRIDISSVTAESYIEFYFKNGGGGYITKIWLEK